MSPSERIEASADSMVRRRLVDFLSPEQAATANMTGNMIPCPCGSRMCAPTRSRGYIDVVSNKGNRWRIHLDSISGNMELLAAAKGQVVKIRDGGDFAISIRIGRRICAYPKVRNVHSMEWTNEACEYVWIGQFLALTYDEDLILKVAY